MKKKKLKQEIKRLKDSCNLIQSSGLRYYIEAQELRSKYHILSQHWLVRWFIRLPY